MADPKLEDVFKLSGIPTHTFVQPVEYNKLLVALRTAGRGVIIEGPTQDAPSNRNSRSSARFLEMGNKLGSRIAPPRASVAYNPVLPERASIKEVQKWQRGSGVTGALRRIAVGVDLRDWPWNGLATSCGFRWRWDAQPRLLSLVELSSC